MVKNPPSGQSSSHLRGSSSHLSLRNTTKSNVQDDQTKEYIGALEAQVAALTLQRDLDARRSEESTLAKWQQWGDSLDGPSGDNDSETKHSSMVPGAWTPPLDRVGKPIPPQRLPWQSISATHAARHGETSPRRESSAGRQAERGTQRDESKAKSLFEGFSEQANAGELPPKDRSLFERYTEGRAPEKWSGESLTVNGLVRGEGLEDFRLKSLEEYTQPFCEFLAANPTVFHAVEYFENRLEKAGFKKVCFTRSVIAIRLLNFIADNLSQLSERTEWNDTLVEGGKYFVTRNGSSLIAFTVGNGYKSGNGVAMIAAHIDALTAKLKPVSNKKTTAGYVQLGVSPFAGALNSTWWDRDLGVGGRVLVKDPETGKIVTKLVKLGWPSSLIPPPCQYILMIK
jgi:hypothetical protein